MPTSFTKLNSKLVVRCVFEVYGWLGLNIEPKIGWCDCLWVGFVILSGFEVGFEVEDCCVEELED